MRKFGCALVCVLNPLLAFTAEQSAAQTAEPPEEVIVIGNRLLHALRLRVIDDEKAAYEVFNRFNDDPRFDISCTMQETIGTRFEKQVCQPEFEIQAYRTHGRHYLENLRDYYNQLAMGNPNPSENTPPMHIPVEAVIASQQKAYRQKMREVAEQHPEFLEALIRYSESRQQYEAAVRIAREQ